MSNDIKITTGQMNEEEAMRWAMKKQGLDADDLMSRSREDLYRCILFWEDTARRHLEEKHLLKIEIARLQKEKI